MPTKRGKKWYTDVVYKYVDVEGVLRHRRIRRPISRKKEDAVAAEVQIRTQIAAGTFNPNPPKPKVASPKFAVFALEEFLQWSATNHSPAHHTEQERMLLDHIIPFFGEEICLDEITTKHIETYQRQRKGQKYQHRHWKRAKRTTAATVNRELSCIKSVLKRAVRWGILKTSPASGIPALKETPNPPELLSAYEVVHLISLIDINVRAAVGIGVYAGLRKMEILRLEWTNVNLKEGVIAAVSREGRRNKSNQDRRIPIAPELKKLLEEHPREPVSKYVFPKAGNPQEHRVEFRSALYVAAREAGIEKITIHQLRHAFCSHALMKGVDPRTVRSWMGHRDLSTTLRYAHTSPDHEQEAIKRLSYGTEKIRLYTHCVTFSPIPHPCPTSSIPKNQTEALHTRVVYNVKDMTSDQGVAGSSPAGCARS